MDPLKNQNFSYACPHFKKIDPSVYDGFSAGKALILKHKLDILFASPNLGIEKITDPILRSTIHRGKNEASHFFETRQSQIVFASEDSFFPAEISEQGTCLVMDHNLLGLPPFTDRLFNGPGVYLNATESHKSFETVWSICRFLVQQSPAHVYIVGGGLTLDVGAFACSLTDIPFTLVPTSLLAMFDAALGGKSAVNYFPFGKNLLGRFVAPKDTFVQPQVLSSLPEKEWKNGLGEVIKTLLIQGVDPFPLLARPTVHLPTMIQGCMVEKIKWVEKDPFDRGPRHILNFGHTLGHALESLAYQKMPHGICVLYGIHFELFLSEQWFQNKPFIPSDYFLDQIYHLGIPGLLHCAPEKMLSAMAHDKKNRTKDHIQLSIIDGQDIRFEPVPLSTVSKFLYAWLDNVQKKTPQESKATPRHWNKILQFGQ